MHQVDLPGPLSVLYFGGNTIVAARRMEGEREALE
jgi:hypothetical protein